MTLTITSDLDRNARRRLISFFERAWDSNDYAVCAQRIRWNRYNLILKEGGERLPEASPNRLARRAMIAVGRTFNYEVE